MEGGGGRTQPSDARRAEGARQLEALGRRKATTVGFAQSSPTVSTRSGTMIVGMPSPAERDQIMKERREKRGTLMLYQELSHGINHQTLSLLQSASAEPANTSSTSSSSAGPKSPRRSKGDISPRSKPEKSPRGSTIKRSMIKLTQSLTGSHAATEEKPAEKSPRGNPSSDRPRDLSQSLDSITPNPQWRHSVAFFNQMGTGFEKMLEDQRNNDAKRWNTIVTTTLQSLREGEEDKSEIRRARERVRSKLRARLLDRFTKRAPAGASKSERKNTESEEEWERSVDSNDTDEGDSDDDQDSQDEESDTEETSAATALVTDDDAELALYSNLSRGVAQLTQSDAVPTIHIVPPENRSHSPTGPEKPVQSSERERESVQERIVAFGRERSGTTAFFNLMNHGAKMIPLPTIDDTVSSRAESDSSDESETSSHGSGRRRQQRQEAKRKTRKTKKDPRELVRELIRIRNSLLEGDGADQDNNQSTGSTTDTVQSVFPALTKPLPLDILALILAKSCMSPKDVGYLHLVCSSWTKLLMREETGNPIWALWFRFHFGGGPFITYNPRDFPVSWRAAYQREWIGLKSLQRTESKTENPAFNMLLHFIYRGHIVLVKELLSGHPETNQLVNCVTNTTALHAACQVGSLPIVRELINHGCKDNVKIGPAAVQFTPFYLACMHGHKDIVDYFIRRFKKESETKAKEKINANNTFASPVLIAAMNSHRSILRLLLQNGGDPNQPNASGELPLFCVLRRCGARTLPLRPAPTPTAGASGATAPLGAETVATVERDKRIRHNVAMLRTLLMHGADAKVRTSTNESVIDIATRVECSDEVISLLRKYGAS